MGKTSGRTAAASHEPDRWRTRPRWPRRCGGPHLRRSGVESEGLGGKSEGIGECLGQVQSRPVVSSVGALLTDSPDLDERGRKVLDGESVGGGGVVRDRIVRTKEVSSPH